MIGMSVSGGRGGTVPPAASAEDAARALEAARRMRALRSAELDAVRAGRVGCAEVLEHARADPRGIGRIRVTTLLGAFPHVGRARARRIMEQVPIAENRRLAGLGVRQRRRLVEMLDEPGGGR